MINRPSFILLVCILVFISCRSQTAKTKSQADAQGTQPQNIQQPNYNYTVEAPENWTIYDTVMQDGLRIRFIVAPQSLSSDYPSANILIASMEGRDIDEFTTRNMDYLKSNMAGITIVEKGNIDSSTYKGRWYTYTKEQNGITRDMINYIIPLNGFAYMITCGTIKGTMNKYRPAFDKIAKSFKG